MKERGIIFSGESVRAILADKKTQTRRIVRVDDRPIADSKPGKYQRGIPRGASNVRFSGSCSSRLCDRSSRVLCPYGVVGDRLWVREAWRTEELTYGLDGVRFAADDAFVQIGDTWGAAEAWVVANQNGKHEEHWRSPIYLPRWASRIMLEVVSVRVERVQDITEEDARAEGLPLPGAQPATINGEPGSVCFFQARPAFAYGWNALNAKRGSWASNPWVWCVSFKRIES